MAVAAVLKAVALKAVGKAPEADSVAAVQAAEEHACKVSWKGQGAVFPATYDKVHIAVRKRLAAIWTVFLILSRRISWMKSELFVPLQQITIWI